jgi:hypothetical protein
MKRGFSLSETEQERSVEAAEKDRQRFSGISFAFLSDASSSTSEQVNSAGSFRDNSIENDIKNNNHDKEITTEKKKKEAHSKMGVRKIPPHHDPAVMAYYKSIPAESFVLCKNGAIIRRKVGDHENNSNNDNEKKEDDDTATTDQFSSAKKWIESKYKDPQDSENANYKLPERYYDMPLMPFKAEGVPKVALAEYFGRRKLLTQTSYKANFHSWNDQNPKSNLLRWTCILVCPLTGELFWTGRYPNTDPKKVCYGQENPKKEIMCGISNHGQNEHVRFWWFTQKRWAEHGAAARAFDCKSFRDRQELWNTKMQESKDTAIVRIPKAAAIGLEKPYLDAIYDIPQECVAIIPENIRLSIREQQKAIKSRNCPLFKTNKNQNDSRTE